MGSAMEQRQQCEEGQQATRVIRRRGNPAVAYLAPAIAFGVIVYLRSEILFEPYASFALFFQALIPFVLILFFYARGAYPELMRPNLSLKGVVKDVVVGLLVTVIWVVPYIYGWLDGPADDAAFDPSAAGEEYRALVLSMRLIGFALVTPVFEELLVRSFLMRFVDVYYDRTKDFHDLPIGQFTLASFFLTTVFFTVSHTTWEAPVAAACCMIYNLLLYHRKTIYSSMR